MKTSKMNIPTEFWIFELVSVQNFTLNWQFWFYWTKFALKDHFWSKTEKMNISTEFCMFTILETKFDQKWPFPVKIGNSEHHHGILHIQISHCTKLWLELTILNFCTKLIQEKKDLIILKIKIILKFYLFKFA